MDTKVAAVADSKVNSLQICNLVHFVCNKVGSNICDNLKGVIVLELD
jgi:hypothetical protein